MAPRKSAKATSATKATTTKSTKATSATKSRSANTDHRLGFHLSLGSPLFQLAQLVGPKQIALKFTHIAHLLSCCILWAKQAHSEHPGAPVDGDPKILLIYQIIHLWMDVAPSCYIYGWM